MANERLDAEVCDEPAVEQQPPQRQLQALSVLVRGVVHDFNNILGVVIAYSDLIGFDQDQPELVASHLGEIRHATGRARDMMGRLSAFGHGLNPTLSRIRISGPVARALQGLRARLPSGVQIEERLSGELPFVLGCAWQIEELTVQLATNSVQSMSNGRGHLSVTVDHVNAGPSGDLVDSSVAPGSYVRLTVADDGCGIDPTIKPRIFEPFFTSKQSDTHAGIGLTIVRGIVADHSAHLSVETRVGRGTAFRILFPECARAATPVGL